MKKQGAGAATGGYVLRKWSVDWSPDHSLPGPKYRLWLKDHLALYGVKNAELAPDYRSPDRQKREINNVTYDSKRALELLRIGSGRADATFRDGQEDAIRHIVEDKGRLLVVQKTSSAPYSAVFNCPAFAFALPSWTSDGVAQSNA